MSTRVLTIALLGAVVVLGGLAAAMYFPRGSDDVSGTVRSTGEALVGGPFELTDHTGRRVTDETWAGKYMLVYFGYTFCPDVCPAGLQVMSAARDMLDDDVAAKVQPLFITVDPERDTVDQMAEYVSHFDDDLVGLTGSLEETARVARAYRVYYKKVDDPSASDYLMDHTSILYLMGPNGDFVTHFAYGTGPKALAEGLATAIN